MYNYSTNGKIFTIPPPSCTHPPTTKHNSKIISLPYIYSANTSRLDCCWNGNKKKKKEHAGTWKINGDRIDRRISIKKRFFLRPALLPPAYFSLLPSQRLMGCRVKAISTSGDFVVRISFESPSPPPPPSPPPSKIEIEPEAKKHRRRKADRIWCSCFVWGGAVERAGQSVQPRNRKLANAR